MTKKKSTNRPRTAAKGQKTCSSVTLNRKQKGQFYGLFSTIFSFPLNFLETKHMKRGKKTSFHCIMGNLRGIKHSLNTRARRGGELNPIALLPSYFVGVPLVPINRHLYFFLRMTGSQNCRIPWHIVENDRILEWQNPSAYLCMHNSSYY